MNPRLLAAGLVVTLFAPGVSLAAQALSAASAITAVTVYTDRAVVTRTASLDLAGSGPTEVIFDRLPATLVDASLQVSGRGAAGVTILDVTARAAHVDFSPNERVKGLEDELRNLARQRRQLDDRASVLKAQETTLGRLENAATTPPTKDSAPRLSLDESTKLLAFLEEQRGKLASDRQALDAQIEEVAARIDAAQRTLNELRGSGGRTFKRVAVRLDVTSTGKLELSLSYAVPGASWTPGYDARVNSNDKTVALGYQGLVRQNTGEDWKGVSLTLSTAQPSLGGAAPEVRPWTLDVFLPRPVPMATTFGGAATDTVQLQAFEVRGPGRAGRDKRELADANAPLPAPVEATLAQAAVDQSTTSASFKIVAAATVPSDNSPQKLPIATVELAADPEYLSSPKLRAAAYLTARVTNSSDYPLLAGALNVFLDGTFVATSRLRTVMPGEKFELALGVDEGLAIKHKRLQRFTEDTGLTNSGKRITYEYLTTIQNNKKTPVRLVVSDQIPVSRQEKIVVKQLAPEPRELKPSAEGFLKWTLELKPGEKRELKLKFAVEHPNDIQVTGLES
ncbi:MAG: mucoidy inhibitor MuiA family protein [Verrucomicrobia bacterium]|nr:mucoidy inhibitor MuiA family protein [Verrucomicrobiota bacterium]